jgi:hypothetical protein
MTATAPELAWSRRKPGRAHRAAAHAGTDAHNPGYFHATA